MGFLIHMSAGDIAPYKIVLAVAHIATWSLWDKDCIGTALINCLSLVIARPFLEQHAVSSKNLFSCIAGKLILLLAWYTPDGRWVEMLMHGPPKAGNQHVHAPMFRGNTF